MIDRNNIGDRVVLPLESMAYIHDSFIGKDTTIKEFVVIGIARIGSKCTIEAFCHIPPGTQIEDNVYIGPHVTITSKWHPTPEEPIRVKSKVVTVKKGARIGAGSIITAGVTVGENAEIGEGMTITYDVPDGASLTLKKSQG